MLCNIHILFPHHWAHRESYPTMIRMNLSFRLGLEIQNVESIRLSRKRDNMRQLPDNVEVVIELCAWICIDL